jgi:hypothetical protein
MVALASDSAEVSHATRRLPETVEDTVRLRVPLAFVAPAFSETTSRRGVDGAVTNVASVVVAVFPCASVEKIS